MRPTIRERVRYWFDNTMARGTPALIFWLAVGSLLLVVLVAVLVMAITPDSVGGNARDALWRSLLRTLDPGTMGGDSGTAPFLALMLLVTVGGIFIVSSLVGVLATGLDHKLADLRKGRSTVVERGHTVVLGWSEQLFVIVPELVLAGEGERVCVAVLADRDKVEMEDAIRARLAHRGAKVVCRTGNPTNPLDLAIVRPDQASAIIVPTPDGEDADVRVIKTLLALRHHEWPDRRPTVVASIADSTNVAAANLAGGPDVTVIDAEDITARLLVQSRRHPGLSAVCTDLLGFEGDELHTCPAGPLVGATYGESRLAYATATVVGVRHADGRVAVNPDPHTVLRREDEMIVLAKSQGSIRTAQTRAPVIEAAISTREREQPPGERTLVLGWNGQGTTIVSLLDQYLPPGSTVTVAAARFRRGLTPTLPAMQQLQVTIEGCEPTNRADLESLSPGSFEHVVVLADDEVSPQHADSRTLVTLLHLRDMKERTGDRFAIVGELTDDANRRLAQVTRADDFVVSSKMISLLLTQLARNNQLKDVFSELFDPGGYDIYLKRADEYLLPGVKANFATVIEAASRRAEVAIGYRLEVNAQKAPAYGVVLNPDKTAPLVLNGFDQVVVLAE
jgi:ion channel POLLUX/CASTOR